MRRLLQQQIAELSGQVLPGVPSVPAIEPGEPLHGPTADVASFGSAAADTAKSAQSAFAASFDNIGAASHQTFAGMKTDLDGVASAVEQAAHDNAEAAAGAPAAGLPQVPAIDPAAVQQLKAFDEQLKEQIATFNKGSVAALEYSVAHGKIADAIKLAGVAGTDYEASIKHEIAALAALGVAKDVKATQDSIAKTQDEISTFHLGAIAAEEYAVAHGKLAESLAKTGAAQRQLTADILETTLQHAVQLDTDAVAKLSIQALTATGQIEAATKATFDLANQTLRADLTRAANAPLPPVGTAGLRASAGVA